MQARVFRFVTAALIGLASAGLATPASAASLPSGERIVGQVAVEPGYDDMTGGLVYFSTPIKAPLPVHSNPRAWAPFYIVVYPTSTQVGTLNCMMTSVPDNCPDHNGSIAGAAQQIVPNVYGGGVLGHDHLAGIAKTGGDFNVAWQVWLVLFTNTNAADSMHITTLSQLQQQEQAGNVISLPTAIVFHCASVSNAVYDHGSPV